MKFHYAPSFPNPDPLFIDPSSPRGSCYFLAWLILSAGLGQAGCQFSLIALLGSDSVSWEGSILCTLLRRGDRLFNTASSVYCFSWLKTDKIFKRILFLRSSLVKILATLEADILSLIGM